jgi:CubicO group peptidase (beta-lactamase class C family)
MDAKMMRRRTLLLFALVVVVVVTGGSFCFASGAVVVDLSATFPVAANHNANPGATALSDATVANDVLGYAVVKGGELVASAGPSWEEDVWSVTKTWVATLIGVMMQNGTVAPNTTLETALPSVDWNAVASAEEKKTITLAQMLSMSSGLQAPCLSYGAQDTVEAVLSSPTFADGEVGSFNYLCSGSILSYVIYQQTGKTPLAYAREVLFPTLGINDDVVWTPTHGSDGIQESGHGLVLGPTDLAKLGQLYLQGGVTGGSSSAQLISADFVNASVTNHLTSPMSNDDCCSCASYVSEDTGYGYMQWLFETPSGRANCAIGFQGQFICTWPSLDLTVAITSSVFTGYDSSCSLLALVGTGLDFESSTSPPPPPSITTISSSSATPLLKGFVFSLLSTTSAAAVFA